VQSSSVFTSLITPLVGLGVISIERMYPLTLGSNIGTTTTSILAALASDPNRINDALQVALVHLFFNISGILLFYPAPFMRQIPIAGAKNLGRIAADHRWFAVLYLVLVFFVIPGTLLSFSLVSVTLSMALVVGGIVLAILVWFVNYLQAHPSHQERLPALLRTWDFLPPMLRSLDPYDRFFERLTAACCCTCCRKDGENDEEKEEETTI